MDTLNKFKNIQEYILQTIKPYFISLRLRLDYLLNTEVPSLEKETEELRKIIDLIGYEHLILSDSTWTAPCYGIYEVLVIGGGGGGGNSSSGGGMGGHAGDPVRDSNSGAMVDGGPPGLYIGAGGGGGCGNDIRKDGCIASAGGGGSGHLTTHTVTIAHNGPCYISIGAAGARASRGGTTTFSYAGRAYSSIGGGPGGGGVAYRDDISIVNDNGGDGYQKGGGGYTYGHFAYPGGKGGDGYRYGDVHTQGRGAVIVKLRKILGI